MEILKALSAGVPMATDVDLERLAAASEGFTGADLKALLYNAQLEAVHTNTGSSSPHVSGINCCRHLFFVPRKRHLITPPPQDNQELSSGSESDMSLSSMIFPNNSSGSEDSAGDADPGGGPDPPAAALAEPSELGALERRENVWRLYFGSSCESERGNSPASGVVSRHFFPL